MAKSQDQFNEKVGKEINVSDEAVDKAACPNRESRLRH